MVYLRVTMVDCGRLWEWCECPSCEQAAREATRNDWDLDEDVSFDLVFAWAWDRVQDKSPGTSRMLAVAYFERLGVQTEAEEDAKVRAVSEYYDSQGSK